MPKCNIPMQPCSSSQLTQFGYDAVSKTLAVRFNPSKKSPSGMVYTYANVPPETFAEFQEAESKGKFFGERIKGHADKFPFTAINEDERETDQAS